MNVLGTAKKHKLVIKKSVVNCKLHYKFCRLVPTLNVTYRHDKSINIDQKLFMIIGKSLYEFVEGLCRTLIECEDSEVWEVFQCI